MQSRAIVLVGIVSLVLAGPGVAVEPWATYRGNSERTGNTDNIAGPATPRVLWVMPSKEHFIASPVPQNDRLYVSGLGGFNAASFRCLSTDPKAAKRVLWSKAAPYMKLPTVSSPALIGDRLIFGDGMHQTDDAILHCLEQKDGLSVWQLFVPGKLVHLEGCPTIAGGRAYVGGGAAGVLAVDLSHLNFEGKEMEPAAIQKVLDKRWQELQEKYKVDFKKDPEFAIPPTKDQLPRPNPVRVWQQGQVKWHVDAPVAVAGDRVLASSAFLDLEKVGDRAVFCLDAKTGAIRWRSPVKLNPWGGPTVSGDFVVVGGSSINYDTKAIKGAKGQIAVLNLADGTEVWRKDVPGGILSCVAVSGGLAVAAATHGKVIAWDLKTGERRWTCDTSAPCFAPPAIAAGVVYAGDIHGNLYAIDLANGLKKWTFELGKDAAVKAPGMIFGGPVVHGGRLYVATCNHEGPSAGEPTVVLCLGER